ncbi:helix-turn-helix domain-containing protein [Runella aurantiaca]|uniref:DNA-binding protein n=1 Tax=Runella aurantiaca TaxID=2282308 RepID=A0A369IHQ0_9BACT|nr:helix-turn-helix domain-containing protein [Runella aurantiaca]RDB06913.1 DNA-binding protein [Runella aurantiaca]
MKENAVIITTPADLEQLIQTVVERVVSNHFQVKNKDDPDLTYPTIMGTEQAASFLGIAESTLYRYTSKRLIPYHKRYQKLYFKKADLQNWVNEARNNTINELKNSILKTKKL